MVSVPAETYPHVEKMWEYMRNVRTGTVDVCLYIRQAVERAYRDHERTDWEYQFDPGRAERVCKVLSNLRHVKGPLAGKKFQVEPWEAFATCQLFGWVVKSGPRAGSRRFRRAYFEIPRGNGKSFLFSGYGVYMLAFDSEQGGEVYSAAPTRDQAKIVLNTMRHMIKKDSDLARKYKIQVLAHHIVHKPSISTAESLSSDSKSIDGKNIFLAMLDELHLHPDRKVYDAVETGCGKRPSSMMLMITTAGSNPVGICWEQHAYVVTLLAQEYEDETTFGLIYTVDEGDEETWDTERVIRKSNPNYGVSVDVDYIASLVKKAYVSEAARGNFKRRHLNIWSDEGSAWIAKETWNMGARAKVDLLEYLDEHPQALLYAGLDLASRRDFAALVFVTVLEGSEPKDTVYRVFPNFYIHQEFVDGSRVTQIKDWVKAKWVNVNPGKVTDFNEIEKDLREIARARYIEEVSYDPYEATAFIKRLESEDGISATVEIPQTVVHLSMPAKEIEPLLIERRLLHDGNPVMAWMVGNVVVQEDRNQNIFLRKRNSDDSDCKIDGPAALITAMVRALREDDRGPSVYEEKELVVLQDKVVPKEEVSTEDAYTEWPEDDWV